MKATRATRLTPAAMKVLESLPDDVLVHVITIARSFAEVCSTKRPPSLTRMLTPIQRAIWREKKASTAKRNG